MHRSCEGLVRGLGDGAPPSGLHTNFGRPFDEVRRDAFLIPRSRRVTTLVCKRGRRRRRRKTKWACDSRTHTVHHTFCHLVHHASTLCKAVCYLHSYMYLMSLYTPTCCSRTVIARKGCREENNWGRKSSRNRFDKITYR